MDELASRNRKVISIQRFSLRTVFGSRRIFIQPRLDEQRLDEYNVKVWAKQLKFQAHCIAQALDCGLTGRVNAIAGYSKFVQDAAYIDYTTPAVAHHQR